MEYIETVHQLKRMHDRLWKEVLSNILTEFGVPKALFWLIKVSFNEPVKSEKVKICLIALLSGMF